MRLFRLVGLRVQRLFDYLPGRSLDDELPLTAYREEEFDELGLALWLKKPNSLTVFSLSTYERRLKMSTTERTEHQGGSPPETPLIPVYIMGKRYEVPEGLTIMKADEGGYDVHETG
ncbi:MAG: hypothetical protein DDT24_00688 [Chloroflexi bacterium]|nr:hypothetical protein [Chloroflexota bacterium]